MQAQAIRKNPPGSSELAALTVQLIDRLKEGLLIVFGGVSVFVLLALLTYSPVDPGWSHTGVAQRLANSGGLAGAWLADLLLYLAGYVAYGTPVLIAFSGWLVFRCGAVPGPLEYVNFSLRCIGAITAVATACGLASLHLADSKALPHHAGGVTGDVMASFGQHVLGNSSTLILAVVFLASFTVFTGVSWLKLVDNVGRWTLLLTGSLPDVAGAILLGRQQTASPEAASPGIGARLRTIDPQAFLLRLKVLKKRPVADHAGQERREPYIFTSSVPLQQSLALDPSPAELESGPRGADGNALAAPASKVSLFHPLLRSKPAASAKGRDKSRRGDTAVELPPLRLLDPAKPQIGGYSAESLETMSRLVEARLADFGVSVEVVAALPGPVITRFELLPAPGVKSSQISNLSKDLARSLSVISVRVVEVIPGKSVIGLEIPNQRREIVSLSEILNSPEYELCQSPLILALGKDISGRPIVVDLARMPHLLVAGTTGAGKSVGLNGMILSMLYKARASQVRLIMIDPKMLELSIYEGIPHLLAPVVTDMKEAANALRWCVGEMERRYRLMASLGVRNLAGYNAKIEAAIRDGKPIPDPLFKALEGLEISEVPTLEPLPFIVVIIDELADMMMVVGKKVEELIARLAQKARAAGVHLILATQRPSVDVITGLIKANIPCRIAFQVSSRVDSRTILDQMGAENLLGQGDMLYLPPGTGIPTRVHGAFVADHEVHAVAEYLKERGAPDYVESILSGQSDDDTAGGFGQVALGLSGDDEADPLYDEAVRIVTETRRASISGVQRRLKVGYNRAARMLETMERSGVVGGLQPNGFREVLAAPPPAD